MVIGVPSRLGQVALLGVLMGLAGPGSVTGAPATAAQDPSPQALRIAGGPQSRADDTPVELDADLYRPSATPAPAVVLAHGFGGSKQSVAAQAQTLADRGFVVLAYTARGFGASGGTISMNSPQFEVADARAMIDELARDRGVVQDAAGDPRVGFAGGSYGGALSLLTAGYDDRVDAVAADITWNDLESALFGQSATPGPRGVFKQWWAGGFFSAGLDEPGTSAQLCGRFAADWCRAFNRAAQFGTVRPRGRALLAASSPKSVTDRITAPTLLGAGQADSLFPFAQAVATYDQIRAASPDVPLKMVWHGGGHDGGVDESDRLLTLTGDWLQQYLAGGPPVSQSFEVTLAAGSLGADSRRLPAIVSLPTMTGLGGQTTQQIAVAPRPQSVRFPAGGAPAAISTFPGLGSLAGRIVVTPPGQGAVFVGEPLTAELPIVGSASVRVQISSARPVREATLFASLQIRTPAGTTTTPAGLVAPVRLTDVGPQPVTVDVALPAIATRAAAGDQILLSLVTTDAAYRLPDPPAIFTVDIEPTLAVPVATDTTSTGQTVSPWLLLVIPLVGLLAGLVWALRPRGRRPGHDPDLADVPLTIRGLSKTYRGGVQAVSDVSFTVPRGSVLGLLGPNGAGKTTTMRMALGLITPSAGEILVFGQRVAPGAAVLSRVGALVEGTGFLPHLSGRANLESYWRATGRSGDPEMAQVLAIAALGSAVERPVKGYSQGMRQRLGIAQAMLGMPDLLVLDEPTNGLDPPQIREMRDVVHNYAATGRTVIVSSHLLAEVERTCTDVVVMQRGRLVAQGSVADLLSRRTDGHLEDVFLDIVGGDHSVGSGR